MALITPEQPLYDNIVFIVNTFLSSSLVVDIKMSEKLFLVYFQDKKSTTSFSLTKDEYFKYLNMAISILLSQQKKDLELLSRSYAIFNDNYTVNVDEEGYGFQSIVYALEKRLQIKV